MTTSSNLLHELREQFGFHDFRPGQEAAITQLLTGRHTLVVMPTGAGKSLIYQLAADLLPDTALVISPLIALMKDQVDALTHRGIPATAINSTVPSTEQSRRLAAMQQKAYRLVYLAPERLRHRPFRQALAQTRVGLLAVDEAHCISQWGHDFRPDYLHIAAARSEMGYPTTVALTATATPQVQDDILRHLNLPDAGRIVTGFNRPNLTFCVRYTPALPDKLRALQELLGENPGAGIVYVGTRREAEEVADFVREVLKREARAYHAGLPDAQRSEIQDDFMAGRLDLVAATNAFGMGIDRADVRFVLHFSIPGTLEAYYQEAGRAGRDGDAAQCVLLYAPQDRALQEWFIENDAPSPQELETLYRTVQERARREVVVLTLDDLALATGLREVALRVGLSLLERMGALHRLGNEGQRLWLEVGTWQPERLRVTAAEVKVRRAHKRRQLARMVAFAEADTCRRRLILGHFGDSGPADAPTCCDNCLSTAAPRPTPSVADREAVEALPTAARVALAVLDTIRRLPRAIGRKLLAQVLKGSRAKKVIAGGYDRSPYYGRLADLTLGEIQAIIGQLVGKGYLKVVGGELPVVHLTPYGRQALTRRESISLRLPRKHQPEVIQRKREEREAGGTVAYTGELLAQGLSPAQIVAHRGLKESTIYNHLAQLIAAGVVDVNTVVSQTVQEQVRAAIRQVGSTQGLSPIKALLPDDISYDLIRCVVAAWERRQMEAHTTSEVSLSATQRAILECVAAFPGQLPRSGVAELLVGSPSRRVEAHRDHPLFGYLQDHSRGAVMTEVDDLITRGHLTRGERGYLVLTPLGTAALSQTATPEPGLQASQAPGAAEEPWRRVVTLGEIGDPRHVPDLIAALEHDSGNMRRLAASALGKIGDPRAVEPLLTLLSREAKPQVRQYAIKALGTIGDPRARATLQRIAADPEERDYNVKSARLALANLRQSSPPTPAIPDKVDEPDEVMAYLSRSHPRPLRGPWQAGWALDFHSRFAGADWGRTETGELAYRFKYGGETALADVLADRLQALVQAHPELAQVDALLPVPPSTPRPTDPVRTLARALEQRIGVPVRADWLVKTRPTRPQKEMRTLAQKQANVAGAFAVRGPVRGRRLLVLDDLYDSGATLEEVTRVLQQAGAATVMVLTLTRTIHSDA
ncbi:MAG: RecQ family ATP-dependent DNA helicase [Anaerolineae bacterium]